MKKTLFRKLVVVGIFATAGYFARKVQEDVSTNKK
jgi:hypothetical protein